PANYHPFRHPEAALERRNWVIDRMVENGYVSQPDGEEAKKQPLGVTARIDLLDRAVETAALVVSDQNVLQRLARSELHLRIERRAHRKAAL
ncbi:hypothetical protein ACC731_37560, partial [Rhizobium ruizarguesonis]